MEMVGKEFQRVHPGKGQERGNRESDGEKTGQRGGSCDQLSSCRNLSDSDRGHAWSCWFLEVKHIWGLWRGS